MLVLESEWLNFVGRLLDWQSHLFTVRHLIVAISRATHGKFVHVLNHVEEQGLLRDYKRRVREIEE